ncbi:right-handed parallel beta-helix repeat-containing protein [Methanosphaerula subterraneus]|uniref:right-handed parallel beta-helix repeat-containing protein n=1 Tax=Methanosphaerula subterraneus TaxID=3350244 RepID=UPI003F82DCE0
MTMNTERRWDRIGVAVVVLLLITGVLVYAYTHRHAAPPTPVPAPPTATTPAVPAGALAVAAGDSSEAEKQTAVYQCDGVDDQAEIAAALAAVPTDGGIVVLLGGTFHITDEIVLPTGTTLLGQGPDRTTIEVTGYYKPLILSNNNCTLGGFKLINRGFVLVTGSHSTVHNITATTFQTGDAEANGAFFVFAKNRVVEDVEFRNCIAVDCGIHGFNVNGDGAPKTTKNLRYIDCSAIRCGNADSSAVWTTGFDFHESNDLIGLRVIRCLAEDNWESGFHFEPGGQVTPRTQSEDIVMEDCISKDNGQRNTLPESFFKSGYFIHRTAVLTNCTSINNQNCGFWTWGGDAVTFNNCTDDGSANAFSVGRTSEEITYNNCVSTNATKRGIYSFAATKIAFNNFSLVTPKNATGSISLGYRDGDAEKQYPVTDCTFDVTCTGVDPATVVMEKDTLRNTMNIR